MGDPAPPNGLYTCPCGQGGSTEVALIVDDLALIQDPPSVVAHTWWHASLDPALAFSSGELHLGSERAAQDRARTSMAIAKSDGLRREFFFYRVGLESTARTAGDVMVEDGFSDHSYAKLLLVDCDIVRYVNLTEAPGSVSLLVSPSAVASVDLIYSESNGL